MKIVQALKLKSPLQKSAVRSMSCLIPLPEEIDQSGSVGKFKVLTQRLVDAGWLSHTDAVEAREEYAGLRRSIMEDPQKASLFKGHLQQRLDEFYAFNIGNKRTKLWEVLKKVLTLSHGQAFVEHGFSTNKETMDINMKGKSLVAQRIICQHVEKVGGILQVEVTQGMMVAASNARASYHLYLEEKKKLVEAEGKRKRKAEKEAEVEGLREKKRRLEEDVSELEKEADSILERSLDAKNTKALVLQCLAMKDMAKKKGNEITEVSSKIEELMK